MTNKIPDNAKCVFKGVIFEVWQWEQKMYDGGVEIFERLKRPNTSMIVPIVGNKILIQTEEQPGHLKRLNTFPCGRSEQGEDSLATAKRELLEETGYTSNDWTLFQEESPVGKIEWTIYTYIAKNCIKTQEQKLDAGEKISTRLIDFEEFLNLADNPLLSRTKFTNTLLRARFDPQFKKDFENQLFKI